MRDEFEKLCFSSTRAYRRYLDRVMRQALLGQRPMEDVAKAAAACKAGAELFMAEKMLARAGEDKEPVHPEGKNGGFEAPLQAKTFRRKRVTVKTGLDKLGGRIDEKSVAIETAADDKTAENDAETETLT